MSHWYVSFYGGGGHVRKRKHLKSSIFSRFVVTSRLRGVDDGPVPPQSLEDRYCFTVLFFSSFSIFMSFILRRVSILVVSIVDFKILIHLTLIRMTKDEKVLAIFKGLML